MSRLWMVCVELVLLSCLGLVRLQNEIPVVFALGMFQNVSIPVNGSVEVNVSRIPAEVAFVTLQFHTQHRNATTSYTRVPVYGSSVTTVDSGLLFPLLPAQSTLSCFLLTPNGDSVAGIGAILPYSSTGISAHSAVCQLMTLSSRDKTVVSFNSIPGQGVIYSIIVRDPVQNSSASYVPVHTYACSFTSTLDGCTTLGRTSTKVFFTITGLAGLLVCFLGHRFFKCVRLALTALIGVVGGVILVMTWWRFGSVMACVVVAGLILGFLISSIIFHTPLGDLSVFHNDVVFWVTFSCFVLVVPLFFIRWPREGNIITCGVVGAYMVVLAVNAYTYTSLSYITLDVLKRFLNDDFSRAFISVPLQNIDFILISVWVILAMSGIVLQLYRERSRPFFPPSPYVLWCQERERRKTNVLDPSHHTPSLPARLLARVRQLTRHQEPAGERTPLLL
ncbi:hypothetical protein PDJAM_G00256710 [Pangasius djambal]|uniref:Uncharacterized protein n=1 Tax=Pangasius djambal TaxID=1691987 RepID=A0ACC5YLG2_9TELE|nr:hypothetical protein [Pangasius djambal]